MGVVKVTQYVERDFDHAGRVRVSVDGRPQSRCYVVLETERGVLIMTEKLADGRVLWQEEDPELESRNSMAKVLRSGGSPISGVTVKDARAFWLAEDQIASRTRNASGCAIISSSQRKRYVQGLFKKACGRLYERPRVN